MPNLLRVWPKLIELNLDNEKPYTAAKFLEIWSKDILGHTITLDTMPFLSVDAANKIVDEMEKQYISDMYRNFARRIREAVNS